MAILRPVIWVGSSKKDYLEFPAAVREDFGFELYLAQTGQHPPSAKPLTGIGRGVVELAGQYDGNAYRAIYSVRFEEAIYVLHAFKKKSKKGISTPAADIALIRGRLASATADHAERFGQRK